MNKVLIKQTRDRLVRDLTTIGYPMAKSEVRRTLDSLLELQRQAIIEAVNARWEKDGGNALMESESHEGGCTISPALPKLIEIIKSV